MRLGRPLLLWAGAFASLLVPLLAACGGGGELLLGATTSQQDTGILDELVRGFQDESGYRVKPIVGGSLQVLELARRGEIDVLVTHSAAAEEKLVADGDGVDRRPVMENQFVLVGPPADPARTQEAQTLREAFQRIAEGEYAFITRADGSGTNVRELAVWQQAGIDPRGQHWYKESTVGQGQSLLMASDGGAYTLVDSATFRVFRDKVKLVAEVVDREVQNRYSVIRVNPAKHAGVHEEAARAFADFVTSSPGQQIIQQFGRGKYGESLFSPGSAGGGAIPAGATPITSP